MLENAFLFTKRGFDTAENERGVASGKFENHELSKLVARALHLAITMPGLVLHMQPR